MKKPKVFPTTDLFKACSLLTVRQLFFKQSVIQIHKHQHFYQLPAHSHDTRCIATKPLLYRHFNLAKTSSQYKLTGLTLYNSLPTDLKRKTPSSFKKIISHWIAECTDFI